MYKSLLTMPILMLSFTGCSIVNQLNNAVDESTCAIYANAEAVDHSTQVVRRNQQLIQESNAVIEKNGQLLEKLSK
jgi:hypothetical protein